jgi:bifunctional non-homologous end joining protein LigD
VITIPAPMHATAGAKPFTDAGWIYEIKFDGHRCMARAGGGQPTELRTKNGANSTKWFPEVAQLLNALPEPVILDGEVCVLDEIGRSDFNRLQARAARRGFPAGAHPVTYCAFDVLYAGGRYVMDQPLAQRKQLLQRVLAPLAGQLIVVSELPADAALFDQVVNGLKLEGFVAKRLVSTYQPGVISPDWLKVKRPGWQEGRKWKK